MSDSFGTKRGTAKFTDDSITFSESFKGYYQSLYEGYWKTDSPMLKLRFIGILASVPLAFIYIGVIIVAGDMTGGILVAPLLVTIWIVVQYIRGFRSSDEIPLRDIKNVHLEKGSPPLTIPRFILEYTTESGDIRKRRINMLSRTTPSGKSELANAVELFEDKGFDVDKSD